MIKGTAKFELGKMIKNLFTRAEFTDLTGIRHQTSYQLEKKNIIVPSNGEYTFNQLIFGRFLEQSRRAFGAKTIKFADVFGSRAQYDVQWDEMEIAFLNGHGVGIIGTDDFFARADAISLIDEWLLPVELECFLFSGKDEKVRAFLLEHFRFMSAESDSTVIAVVGRIRRRLIEEIEVRGLEDKLEKSVQRKADRSLVASHC